MKLGDFLKGDGKRHSPTRLVTFRVMGLDDHGESLIAEATAELAFVSEGARQEALRDAEKELATQYGGQPIPDERRDDEGMYHLLHRALRDKDDVRQPFATSVKELKGALVLPEATFLWGEYSQFRDEEFPERVDVDTFNKLVDEARKSFLPDLLSRFAFDDVRRSMPGLLKILRKK